MMEEMISFNPGRAICYFNDGRYLHAGVTRAQWPAYLSDILRILKPNDGWAQMMELAFPYVLSENNSLPDDAPVLKVLPLLP